MTDGCDIINASDNINLWRKLTYANVKVIGRRDLLKIVFEAGELSYPEDYPDTHSYQLYIKQVKNKNILKFRNRPKNRRVNYIKLHSPFPFGPNFDILSKNQPFLDSYTRVQLAMLGRGVPNKFSYICLPIQEDIETAKELIASERNSGVTHVHTEVEDSAAWILREFKQCLTKNWSCISRAVSLAGGLLDSRRRETIAIDFVEASATDMF
jgi:hypothetical protein